MEDVMSRWLLSSSSNTASIGGVSVVTTGGTQKRKFSQDMSDTATAAAVADPPKRIKCSHLSPTPPQATSVSSNAGIATNTIMITNNYSKNGLPPTTTTGTSNSSQITILAQHDDGDDDDVGGKGLLHHRRPMVVDQINICINNHFSSDSAIMTTTASATAKSVSRTTATKVGYEADVKETVVLDVEEEVRGFTIKKEPTDEMEDSKAPVKGSFNESSQNTKNVLPSTHFSIGEEVLVPRSDDSCFYLGILTVLREDQCLVQFEDGTNCWASVAELKRLLRQPDTVYCVVCKTREQRAAQHAQGSSTVHECVHCGRVYHKVCLQKELNQLIGTREDAIRLMEKTKCLRCFKREEGIDQEVDEDSESRDVMQRNNSSNTGNSTKTNGSVIAHQQLEIGAPSMDWFKKEVMRSGATDDADMEMDDDAVKQDEEAKLFEDANGRRLRKRDKKQNYKDIQRIPFSSTVTNSSQAAASATTGSSSWSCASSTTSSSSMASGGILLSPFITASATQPQFTLEELRWAFLPKSHKSFKRRSTGVATKPTKDAKKPAKVPYTEIVSSASSSRTSSRRASREIVMGPAAVATTGGGSGEYTNISRSCNKEDEADEFGATENDVPDKRPSIASGGECKAMEARLAKGEKYVLRARRRDSQGNVQYLVEWISDD